MFRDGSGAVVEILCSKECALKLGFSPVVSYLSEINAVLLSLPTTSPFPTSFHFSFSFFLSCLFLSHSKMFCRSMIKLFTPRFRYETACHPP